MARTSRPRSTPRNIAAMLFIELTGEPLGTRRLGTRLRSSLTTLRAAVVEDRTVVGLAGDPLPGGPARVDVFVRNRRGTGCDQVAEIAGTYFARLKPGQACIGAAAVKTILDDAAARLCCSTLECPSKCPCSYVPQPALANYWCIADGEGGALLQGNRVWNCMCFSN